MVEVLSLAPCYSGKKPAQVLPGDQPGYLKDTIESFVGHSSMGLLCPPALKIGKREDKGRKGEKFYIYLDVTHTHTQAAIAKSVKFLPG